MATLNATCTGTLTHIFHTENIIIYTFLQLIKLLLHEKNHRMVRVRRDLLRPLSSKPPAMVKDKNTCHMLNLVLYIETSFSRSA